MKEELTQAQINSTFDEIFKQSDRAAGIVSGSILEEILQRMITAFLMSHPNISKTMFDGVSPLSTFAAKIDLSYHLGLINETEYKDLNLIKKIRNEFAHSIKAISFDTNIIKDRCQELKTLQQSNPPKVMYDNIKSVKMFYQINTTMLAAILFDKAAQIKELNPYKYDQSK